MSRKDIGAGLSLEERLRRGGDYLQFDEMSEQELREMFVQNLDFLNTPDFQGKYPIHHFAETPTAKSENKYLKRYDPRIFKIFGELGLLDLQDQNGKTALYYAVYNYKAELLDILVESGAKANVRNKDGLSAIDSSLTENRIDTVKKMLERMGKEDFEEEMRMETSFLYFLLIDDRFNEILQRKFGELFGCDAADFYNLKLIGLAKIVLGLSYSEKDFPIPKGQLKNLHQKIFSQTEFPLKAEFGEIFCHCDKDARFEYERTLSLDDGRKLKIVKPSTTNHATFMVFEYDASGRPIGFFYCDGNLPNFLKSSDENYGYGACYFRIKEDFDPLKFENLACFRTLDSDSFKDVNSLPAALQGVVEESSIAEAKKLILTQPQERGNCGFKATNILFRLILNLLHPQEMTFEEKDGKPCGSGHHAYKEYRSALNEEELDVVFSFAAKEQSAKFYYPIVVGILRDVFGKAILKDDRELVDRIKKFSAEHDLDFSEVKDQALVKVEEKKQAAIRKEEEKAEAEKAKENMEAVQHKISASETPSANTGPAKVTADPLTKAHKQGCCIIA